jgi:pimeloyl-ACP methyl ester carboxylesterase
MDTCGCAIPDGLRLVACAPEVLRNGTYRVVRRTLPVERSHRLQADSRVPLLFVWPENDRFLAPAVGKPSVDKIPTARFVTMPGGHFPWYDDPDRCASLVAEGL